MDVQKLIESLDRHNVYKIQPGRTLNDKDEPVPDIETLGLVKLLDGYPSRLDQYNRLFKSTQDPFSQPRISQMVSHTTLPRGPPEAPSSADVEGTQSAETTEDQRTVASAETEDAESAAGTDDEADPSGEDEDELIEALKAPDEDIEGSEQEWASSDSESEVFGDGEQP